MQLADWINSTLLKNGKIISSRCTESWLIKHAPDQWQSVIAATMHLPLTASRAERIYCALNDISAPIKCPVCQIRVVPFRKDGYSPTCNERSCMKLKSEYLHVAPPMNKSVREKLMSKEWLSEQLLAKGATELATELHVPVTIVLNYAIQFDIEIENITERFTTRT